MKRLKLAHRLMVIDRFFIATNELPYQITYSHTEGKKWQIFTCVSANFTHEIAFTNIFHTEVSLYS